MVINIDVGVGRLDEKTGKPMFLAWQGAEKTYADFELGVTNPGGHSSQPRADNAINQLAARAGADRPLSFPAGTERSDPRLFRQRRAVPRCQDRRGDARFCRQPERQGCDRGAERQPGDVGKIGTTCVATMIQGGHARNALPQRASANINCRIFRGTSQPRSWRG